MQALKLQIFFSRTKFTSFSNRVLSLSYCNTENLCYFKSCVRGTPIKHTLATHPHIFLNNYHPVTYFSSHRHLSTKKDKDGQADLQEDEPIEKLSLFKRYKKMFKEYWYVLLPVHMFTSMIWFGSFYYASTCGLDIIPFLEYVNLPESLIKPLRNSSLGHIAVASALYKLATPARYMVTVGGSTFAVNFLKKRGLIRPAPTKAELKTLIQNKLKKDGVSEKD